jgi:hypothetical protein
VAEPHKLAPGWAGFDHAAALGCPVKLVNDAEMQALGSYKGGKMLFLGLGTGLGSTLVVDGLMEPMAGASSLTRREPTRTMSPAGMKKRGNDILVIRVAKNGWRRCSLLARLRRLGNSHEPFRGSNGSQPAPLAVLMGFGDGALLFEMPFPRREVRLRRG